MQKGTQRGPETLLTTVYLLLSSGRDILQPPAATGAVPPAHLRSQLECRCIFSSLGLQGHLGSLAEAGVTGDGLLTCRRSALVEGLSCQVKEL